jgi:hypothetical protein
MKLSQLKQIIKEEIGNSLNEATQTLTINDIAQACIERLDSEQFAYLRQPGLVYQGMTDKEVEKARVALGKANDIHALIAAYNKLDFSYKDICVELLAAITKKDW